MSNVPTVPNREVYLFNNVPLGVNQFQESLYINENEAWFDQDGLIRLFSMKFDDGAIGNFMLMPKNKPIDIVLKIVRDFLVPLGLNYTGNKIFNANTRVNNVGKYLYNEVGKVVLKDLVEQQIYSNLGYVAMDNGELVFRSPMTMSMGKPLKSVEIKVVNRFNKKISFETSRDAIKWTILEVEAGKEFVFHFGNGQKTGYLRLNIGRGYLSYKIEAQKTYSISWSLDKGHFDLFIE